MQTKITLEPARRMPRVLRLRLDRVRDRVYATVLSPRLQTLVAVDATIDRCWILRASSDCDCLFIGDTLLPITAPEVEQIVAALNLPVQS